jgi:hypothetical protein
VLSDTTDVDPEPCLIMRGAVFAIQGAAPWSMGVPHPWNMLRPYEATPQYQCGWSPSHWFRLVGTNGGRSVVMFNACDSSTKFTLQMGR